MTDAGAKQRKSLSWAWMGLAGAAVILMAVAAGLFWAARVTAADGQLLAREGVPIAAVVVDRTMVEEWDRTASGNRVKELSYTVTIRYRPEGRDAVTARETVTKERYDAMPQGTAITVIHVPSRPEVFELEPGDRLGDAWLMQGIGLAMGAFAIGAGIGARVLRRATRHMA